MVKLKEVIQALESFAPPVLQEDYDNSGLIISSTEENIAAILITLDVTEAVVDEAIRTGANLIVAHHPLIFNGLKKINDDHDSGRAIRKAILHNIHIYAIHTNLDNIKEGVNGLIAEKLGLGNTRVLLPKENIVEKLVTYCPPDSARKVLDALHEAGAGVIGNYDRCSFRSAGTGSFRPGDEAHPYTGTLNKLEEAQEDRIELQFPVWLEKTVLEALHQSHPYEEVAYFLQKVSNVSHSIGAGLVGSLPEPIPAKKFLPWIKERLELNIIKYTFSDDNLIINKVAVCGGAGSYLIKTAISAGADAYLTADIKYHDYFLADSKIMLVDIGHHESEKFTKDLLHRLISKKFSNIALHLSKVNTNPVHYL